MLFKKDIVQATAAGDFLPGCFAKDAMDCTKGWLIQRLSMMQGLHRKHQNS